MTAVEIAEKVVQPVMSDRDPAIGLFLGDECKFTIPVQFVFGQPDDWALNHLLEELRLIVQRAVEMA